ncbi:MAG: helix-turn-helix domain-containing protein [Eubacteriales bacterium]|nr:helix-turn-helix domain-containing protein [Eubacteriales bacterium]
MARRFKEARKKNNLKLTAAAKLLGVSQPTLSSWEAGRKSPTLDNLEKMAELYDVTTDYLLGREKTGTTAISLPLTQEKILISNGKPLWSSKYGWLLISASAQEYITATGERIPFDAAGKVIEVPERFAESNVPQSEPLTRSDVTLQTQVWVEPISPDSDLREQLRGWYQVKDRFVENEYGIKFSIDSYGAKWLAFKSNI